MKTMKRASARRSANRAGQRLLSVAPWVTLAAVAFFAGVLGMSAYSVISAVEFTGAADVAAAEEHIPALEKTEYDRRLLALAHVATTSPWYTAYLLGTTTPLSSTGGATSTSEPRPLWPKRASYPKDSRALLPFNRIVAYYGNFYSKGMGVLGEYPEEVMLEKLLAEKAAWEAADPTTPVVPAIEYIDVTAQGSAGKDGKYRLRMPDNQADKALAIAEKIDGIVVLDLQVGLSSVEEELPLLDKYLAQPNVHIAIDPEFDMLGKEPPGRIIGTTDAATINWAARYMAKFVDEYNLPPKILLIHRFTQDMLTDYQDIKPLPQVQVVVQMDGWGSPQRKKNTYYTVVAPEPVQFTGLKFFYKNDLKENPPRLLTIEEVLNLKPTPIYIQYQ